MQRLSIGPKRKTQRKERCIMTKSGRRVVNVLEGKHSPIRRLGDEAFLDRLKEEAEKEQQQIDGDDKDAQAVEEKEE